MRDFIRDQYHLATGQQALARGFSGGEPGTTDVIDHWSLGFIILIPEETLE
jgi:hypothetical protein